MSAAHPFESALETAWPAENWRDVSVLLGVSGGADSVALARAMVALKGGRGLGRIVVGHFNHRLRGADSDDDQQFVAGLCGQLGVEFRAGRAQGEGPACRSGDGIEAAARSLRYNFFRQTGEELGCRYVVTAHTAEDQAETILHRIIRGTGINGLAGIARTRTLGAALTVIRPLLGIHRPLLLEYLAALGQPFRTDATNSDRQFTRNRIRHEVLPSLATFNSGVVDALLRLGQLAGEVQTVVDTLVDDLAERCLRKETAAALEIDLAELAMQPGYLIRELLIAQWQRRQWPLQAMGFEEWDELADMIYASAGAPDAAPRKRMFPGGVSVQAEETVLRLERQDPKM